MKDPLFLVVTITHSSVNMYHKCDIVYSALLSACIVLLFSFADGNFFLL